MASKLIFLDKEISYSLSIYFKETEKNKQILLQSQLTKLGIHFELKTFKNKYIKQKKLKHKYLIDILLKNSQIPQVLIAQYQSFLPNLPKKNMIIWGFVSPNMATGAAKISTSILDLWSRFSCKFQFSFVVFID